MLIQKLSYYWLGTSMQANLNLFDLISTSMSHVSRPPFGMSNHNYILSIPAYKQKIKQEVQVTHSIRKWSGDTDATLQDCFASTDWNMFPGFQ